MKMSASRLPLLLITWSALSFGSQNAGCTSSRENIAHGDADTEDAGFQTGRDIFEDPFGISIAGFLSQKNLPEAIHLIKTAGAHTVRFMSNGDWGALVWGEIEPQKATFDWSASDAHYLEASKNGLAVLVNIYPINEWDAPDIEPVETHDGLKLPMHYPNDMEEYLDFITRAAKRYDGDGEQDAPGSPTVDIWILGTEMEGEGRWDGTPEEYADLFVKTYDAIKLANPNATIMTYGTNIAMNKKNGEYESFTKPMLEILRDLTNQNPTFSFVYAIHYYPEQEQFVDDYVDVLTTTRNLLDGAGFPDTPIALTDVAVFVGIQDPLKEQKTAKAIIKTYALGLAYGTKMIIWAQSSDAGHGTSIEAGLVSPDNDGTYYRNLAYYTYRLMTEKLETVEWDDTNILRDGDMYVIEFSKENGKIWVAWNENPAEQKITITGIDTSQVTVTEAVAAPVSGIYLREDDYPDCFAAETKTVTNGSITITLDETPVFVEERETR